MQENRVRVVARFAARAESIEDAKRILGEMIDPTRAEEGCITYELLQNAADPTDLTFVEEWRSQSDLDRHAVSEHIKTGRERAVKYLANEPDVQVYSLVK